MLLALPFLVFGLLWAAWPSSSSGSDFCLYVMKGGDLLKRWVHTRGRS